MKKSSENVNLSVDILKNFWYTLAEFRRVELKIKNLKCKGVDTMVYDYSKLNGKIVEVFGTRGKFAEQMNLSERTISLKLNNKIPWKQTEIQRAMEILNFQVEEIQDYFFTR